MSLPKTINIVITGTAFCGKKTFINSIREKETYDGGLVPASSYFGRVRLMPDITLFLFPAAPGARPLKLLSEILDQTFMGAVILVDSTRPEAFRDTHSVIAGMVNDGVPIVVAANKQDLTDAWRIDDLRIALNLDDDVPIVPCRAHDRESVKLVLENLFSVILRIVNEQGDEPTQTFVAPPPPAAPAYLPPSPSPSITPLAKFTPPPAPSRPVIKPLSSVQGRAKNGR